VSNDPWGSDDDPFEDEGFVSAVAVSEAEGSSFLKRHTILVAVSSVVAVTALVVSLAGSANYGAVGLAAVAYLFAVLADLSARRSRYAKHDYRRPLLMVGLRFATFAIALWVGWLAASSLAGPG